MDVALVLDKLIPTAQYSGSLTANTQEAYENLFWEDERAKPSWEDIENAWITVAKSIKLDELANARYEEEVSGYEYNGYTFHSDRESQSRLAFAAIQAEANSAFTQNWKTKNGYCFMTAADFVTLEAEFQSYLEDLYAKEQSLAGQVDACTTIEEVEVIAWNSDESESATATASE